MTNLGNFRRRGGVTRPWKRSVARLAAIVARLAAIVARLAAIVAAFVSAPAPGIASWSLGLHRGCRSRVRVVSRSLFPGGCGFFNARDRVIISHHGCHNKLRPCERVSLKHFLVPHLEKFHTSAIVVCVVIFLRLRPATATTNKASCFHAGQNKCTTENGTQGTPRTNLVHHNLLLERLVNPNKVVFPHFRVMSLAPYVRRPLRGLAPVKRVPLVMDPAESKAMEVTDESSTCGSAGNSFTWSGKTLSFLHLPE